MFFRVFSLLSHLSILFLFLFLFLFSMKQYGSCCGTWWGPQNWEGKAAPSLYNPCSIYLVVLTANHREMFVTSWCLIWVLNVFRQSCPTCGPHAAWPNLSSGPTPEPCHHGGSSAFLSCLSQPQTHIHRSQQPNTGAQLMLSGLKLCQQYCLSKSTGIRS